jgi:Cysteine-rich CWC
MKEKTGEILICESCKKQFSCGAKTEKCWCFEMNLESETLSKLRQNFKSCLCIECLLKLRTTISIAENEKLSKDTT